MANREVPFPSSIIEFMEMFKTEEDCLEWMMFCRYPNGAFECEHCSGMTAYYIESRHSIECGDCKRQLSLTSGTVMEKTHMPLKIWFLAAFYQTTLKPGISALQFQRQAGLSRYETAYQILHKLRAGMVNPEREKLSGVVEMDETFIGGHRIGPRGRGANDKSQVIGAVEVLEGANGPYSGRVRLRLENNASGATITKFLEKYVEPGTEVRTDGWAAYNGIERHGYIHSPIVLNDPMAASKTYPHIHRVFGNLKAVLIGTHHGVSSKHIQAYLNEYTFRFNRRWHPMESFNKLLGLVTHSRSATYDELYTAGSKEGWIHPNPPKWDEGFED